MKDVINVFNLHMILAAQG